MVIVGITGGIGSGKSLAADFFRSRGAAIVDADEVARELMMPGSPLLAAVAAEFGPHVLHTDGSLDRRKLARLVFGNATAVAKLNALTHPAIIVEVEKRLRWLAIEAKTRVACLVAPLLLEAGGRGIVNRLLVMWADEEERIRRVVARDGLSELEVRERMSAQMPPCEQLKQADWVVDTSAGEDEALRQLEMIWSQLTGEEDANLGKPCNC